MDRQTPARGERRERNIDVEPGGTAPIAVIAIARPRVLRDVIDDSSGNWIEVDVPDQSEKVPILLNEERFVSALKEVSDPSVAAVEPLGIGRLKPCHHAGKWNGARSHGEVYVVCHQAVSEELEPESFALMGNPIEVFAAIQVVPKDGSLLISACSDVVHSAGKMQPRRARHLSRAFCDRASTPPIKNCRERPGRRREGSATRSPARLIAGKSENQD